MPLLRKLHEGKIKGLAFKGWLSLLYRNSNVCASGHQMQTIREVVECRCAVNYGRAMTWLDHECEATVAIEQLDIHGRFDTLC